ncbi:putative acetamidase [Triangularia verruculosa]|uniref:amidase n=1 Tax=Triangularia verruculosa TaxID=2587418 RepID=A0AAN6XBB9_9PEZI|nr:putative acetamidase [Triangularia verruculosa]
MFLAGYLRHKAACWHKQNERKERIAALPDVLRGPITVPEKAIIHAPIEYLVSKVHNGTIQPQNILKAYSKIALRAHQRTNCLTEIMIPSAEEWIASAQQSAQQRVRGQPGVNPLPNLHGPLAGIPVSLKDTIVVGGYDTTLGYSAFAGNAQEKDGAMVRMLKDMGAIPHVKTNCPITLLSFESGNDLWGATNHPLKRKYSPGGSTGGESALLAMGGSRIGVGSDVAGSVRLPAHWGGCYALRCSTGRWPKAGIKTSMPGQEGVPSVYSPMARTLGDLRYFTREVIKFGPWRYDTTVHPLEWRGKMEEEFEKKKKLKVGVLWSDGVVDPSPACKRALKMVVEALEAQGHEIVNLEGDNAPPDMYEGLKTASLLLNADGGKMFDSFRLWGERLDSGAAQIRFMAGLWNPFRYAYHAWVKYIRKDEIWAGLIRNWRPQSALENWKLVGQREAYRARWFEWWNQKGLDVIITPPNATPALPLGAMKDAVSSCGYTFMFNLLDYTAGVLPITHVDAELDALPKNFNIKKLNGVAQGAYKYYDAKEMDGLPVGVQVVGRRLEEEKVLAVMQRVEDALGENKYKIMEPEETEVLS